MATQRTRLTRQLEVQVFHWIKCTLKLQVIPSTNSESQRKPCHKRRSRLEISRQEIYNPFPYRPHGGWFLVSERVRRVEQVLESRCHARPVHLDEGHGTEILKSMVLLSRCDQVDLGVTYLENNKEPTKEEGNHAGALLGEYACTEATHSAESQFVRVHRRLWRGNRGCSFGGLYALKWTLSGIRGVVHSYITLAITIKRRPGCQGRDSKSHTSDTSRSQDQRQTALHCPRADTRRARKMTNASPRHCECPAGRQPHELGETGCEADAQNKRHHCSLQRCAPAHTPGHVIVTIAILRFHVTPPPGAP